MLRRPVEPKQYSSFYIGNGRKFILLESDTVTVTAKKSGLRRHDKIDLALIPLHNRTLQELHGFRFLPPDRFDVSSGTFARRYLALGFPETRSRPVQGRKVVASEANAYSGVPADPAIYPRLRLSVGTHVLVKFRRNRVVGEGGVMQKAPDPLGMSGGGLWRFRLSRKTPDQDLPMLAGILIEHHKRETVIAATRAFLILHMVGQRFPELRQHLPPLPYVRIRTS